MRRRRDPYTQKKGKAATMVWLIRLAVLFVTVTGCLTAGVLVYDRLQEARLAGGVAVEGGSPELNALERLYLQRYLASRAKELDQPVGAGQEPVTFVVAAGQSADEIAANLAAAGLLGDPELFTNYLRFYGLDDRLEAGTYQLSPQLTTPELAQALTRAFAQDVEVRFVEGWRYGELADYLAEDRPGQVDPVAFLAIVERQAAFDLSRYDFLASLPPEATLEGFLFPDTYRLPADADAAYLVQLMLDNFGRRVTPAMRQAIGVRGLTVFQAVTLASIVEREAAVAQERPVMAGVFFNRLEQGINLEADPTIQYALGYQAATDQWWKSPLFQVDLELDSPYNTYLYPGLPPGPIANPGLAALEAVAFPAETDYLFFVADCAAAIPGSHLFSATYEEHLANVERCR
ncbi:MAG: endolytic transglycosylase MltG [Chloroflexi bacterium]|nr:endolytic transglycosylase MltG [Chloroflexota bacterium]MCI0647561.1 endolytic transglycosylase MltG [Chloroflexota bacterium]MCI0729043.1 endolytic transglycosylase MltG [Chloroflexota bacterium]